MATELDILMDLDPLDLTTENLDQIVAYHRARRAEAAATPGGRKPKKEAGPSVGLGDVVKSLLGDRPKAGQVTRRL